ncbi:EF-hand [Conidiobolus coronatus NRRL 28638]|uniref:EF-hand n=1 Tax=Conidiobolus coronatus (strain ATCC 28846 / CBS 209.66 / NRRL 28638) TaxID=796925 RepID=A0A137P255_CONC2|nr:EF-hand [Conidiobolus coronatus NRRL 28638]|eukprot:KXN69123.1 EF-hand [Conidiobolus coronatus NRRL 28638]
MSYYNNTNNYSTPYNNGGGSYRPPPPNYQSGYNQGPQQGQQNYQQQAGGRNQQQQLWDWFKAIDIDNSGALTTDELQQALVNGDWSPFNIETVRLMLNMFDDDHSGTITFNEFQRLWEYIEQWKSCFQRFDADQSGTIDGREMGEALRAFGFNLSPKFINLIILKFDAKGRGNISFDSFIQACVTIKMLTDSFRRFDNDNDGWIQIQYEQFLELVMTNK